MSNPKIRFDASPDPREPELPGGPMEPLGPGDPDWPGPDPTRKTVVFAVACAIIALALIVVAAYLERK